MCRYPDTLNNPNADPRVYQEQYERWWRERPNGGPSERWNHDDAPERPEWVPPDVNDGAK